MADDATPTTEATTQSSTQFQGDFDADRAARLVDNLRADKEKLAARLAAFEKAEQERADAAKSEAQKAIERAERAERELAARDKAAAERAALKESGLDPDLADILAITDPKERAAKLAEKLAPKADGSADGEPAVAGKPKPKLTPGHLSSSGDDLGRAELERIADEAYKRLRG